MIAFYRSYKYVLYFLNQSSVTTADISIQRIGLTNNNSAVQLMYERTVDEFEVSVMG